MSEKRLMEKIPQDEDDRLSLLAQALGRRMQRRGFLGTLGKGAAVVAVMLSGGGLSLSFGVQEAAACGVCDGCYGQCGCGYYTSTCYFWYNYEGTGWQQGSCSRFCPYFYECCFAVSSKGTFPVFCPCNSYDCTCNGGPGPC